MLFANTCGITTKNEITKVWPTRSFSQVTTSVAAMARFNAGNVWEVCFGITVVTRRSYDLGRMQKCKLTVCADSANQTQVLVLAAGFA